MTTKEIREFAPQDDVEGWEKPTWEEEFDKMFTYYLSPDTKRSTQIDQTQLKSFIKSLLSQNQARVVERMRPCECSGNNTCQYHLEKAQDKALLTNLKQR